MIVRYSTAQRRVPALKIFTHDMILRALISKESVTDIHSFCRNDVFPKKSFSESYFITSSYNSASDFPVFFSIPFQKLIKDLAGMFRYAVQSASHFPMRTSEREIRNLKREAIFLFSQKEKDTGFFTVFLLSRLNYKRSTIGICTTVLPPYIPGHCLPECS
jgi:hypothetical protein